MRRLGRRRLLLTRDFGDEVSECIAMLVIPGVPDVLEPEFKRLIDAVKAEAKRLRGNGRRCCANQLLHVAAGLERELVGLKLERSERGVRRG